ncbi:MAG: LysR family transcriptional regulator [Burkholderiaceae bacterium]|nr:LysR family transcriptional regulator [Burkholderiaceae bacterium]
MDRLAEMMTFVKVVETKSFSAAARQLGSSKSLVSKQVSQLEAGLGVRLLHRTTRSLGLTEIGSAFYEHCARIEQQIGAAMETVKQLQVEPRGILKLTSPVIFASLHLAPILQAFQKRYSQVEVELNASDRAVDLVEEGYDLALRISSDPAPGMVARKIAPMRWAVVAAPSYLKRHGTPQTPQDLLRHNCLVYQGLPAKRGGWRFKAGGREVSVPVTGNCRANNQDVLHAMARDGIGIAMFPTYAVYKELKSGKLVELLVGQQSNAEQALYAMYMPHRYMQPKVRVFIDHLFEYLGAVPYWDR